jgi:hypothetical protein
MGFVSHLVDHGIEEGTGDVRLEQALAILAERRRRPDRLVETQPDEPPKQEAVVDLFNQQPLAAIV